MKIGEIHANFATRYGLKAPIRGNFFSHDFPQAAPALVCPVELN
jgi:hypothetical protein